MDSDGGIPPKQAQQLIFDSVSPATRLLEKRRQMYEVQDALENQKARFQKEEEQHRKREETLRTKDLQLQHQLFKFNKFLQDNEAKRRRAETRASEEAAQIRQKEDDIRDLEQQLEDSHRQCKELDEEVSKNMKYEAFLERVKETSEDYSEIQELVTRYETLESANKDLLNNQQKSEDKIEELRNEVLNYRKQQEMEMLDMTNRIASLSAELDEVQKTRAQLEDTVDVANQEDSQHSLKFGQILMSVDNLYLRCTTKRKNIRHAEKTLMDDEEAQREEEGADEPEDSFRRQQQDAIRQLRVIYNYLKDFKDIHKDLRNERKAIEAHKAKSALKPEEYKETEVRFVYETAGPQDRGSTQSGSQTNTRDLSTTIKQGHNTSGSGGVGAGATGDITVPRVSE